MFRLVRAAPLAVIAAVLLAAPAVASKPPPIQFTGQAHNVSGVPGPGNTFDVVLAGTDVAEGALTGTFAFIDHTVISPGGHLHVDRVLTQGYDTISMEVDADFVGFTANTESVSGRWTITSGTGVYANLAGIGSYTATVTIVTIASHTINEALGGFAFFNASN